MQTIPSLSINLLLGALISSSVALPSQALGQVVNEDLKILASDGDSNDRFGIAIDIDNGIIAVGSQFDESNAFRAGSVYLYNATTGEQIAKLLAEDGAAEDEFGAALAINNGIVAIGARWDDDNANATGSVYLFDADPLSPSFGEQITKLTADDASAGDLFGTSVAIDNAIVAIGAQWDDDNGFNSGSVYLFNASTGMQITKIIADDGQPSAFFGSSIAMSDGMLAVGAKGDNNSAGSAYLFDIASGIQLFKLQAIDGSAPDSFGSSIDIDNAVVAVGAPLNNDFGNALGSAYLFDAKTGEQIARLLPDIRTSYEFFAHSIAIENNIVAIGTQDLEFEGQVGTGYSYLFDVTTATQIRTLIPSDGTELNFFGNSIAIDNAVIAVGAIFDAENGVDSGSAYVFNVNAISCPADLTGDGMLNFFDVSAFLAAFASQNPIADFNNDGFFNFFDVSAFLAAFSAGCP